MRKDNSQGRMLLRRPISQQSYVRIAIVTFVLLFAVWTVLSVSGAVSATFLPSPISVVQYLIEGAQDGTLWGDMSVSIFRVTTGFAISTVLAIPLGIFAGSFKRAEAIITPLCEFIRYMPVPAFVPLTMVWIGIGEEAKIFIVFLGCFFQEVLMIADDARSVSDDLLSSAYTLGTSRWTTITKVLIPAMGPRIMQTMRMVIGWGWTYLTVAELVASQSGLGYSILRAQRFMQTDAIFGGILVIGILGLITDRLFALVQRLLFPWDN